MIYESVAIAIATISARKAVLSQARGELIFDVRQSLRHHHSSSFRRHTTTRHSNAPLFYAS